MFTISPTDVSPPLDIRAGEVCDAECRRFDSVHGVLVQNAMSDRRRMRSREDSSDVHPGSSMTSTSTASGDDQEKRALRERITTLEKKVSDLESRLDVQQSRTGNVGGSLSDVLRDPSEKYTIESLKKAGIAGWPVVDGVRVLVPIYSLAKNTEGQLVCVVYAIMEVAKLVHTSYLVTTIPGGDVWVCVRVCGWGGGKS